jgi:hypothetical protein
MSDVIQAVYERLSTGTAVTALVSTRIYPIAPPQNATLPYVLIGTINETRYPTLTGATGVATSQLTIACVADTRLAAHNIAEAIRARINGFRGVVTPPGLNIRMSVLQSRREVYLPPQDASGFGLFSSEETYTVHFLET